VDTLLGKYSPAGRLPVTFYDHTIMKTRDPVDMKLRTGSGITYQHYRGTPLWEYGFDAREKQIGGLGGSLEPPGASS
jgi:hypothetical protein